MIIEDDEVIKSVRRVFEVLEWFDRFRAPARATVVARGLQYPMSSTNALLKSLSQRGYLSFDPIRHEYAPTTRLSFEGNWLERQTFGCGKLKRLVNELQDRTGEIVSLSCQSDLEMLFVEVTRMGQTHIVSPSAGAMAPLFHSSIGVAALSSRTDREIKNLLNRYNRRTYNPARKADLQKVLRNVGAARSNGYYADYDTYISGMGAISWALPVTRERPTMVVAVAGSAEKLRDKSAMIIQAGSGIVRRVMA